MAQDDTRDTGIPTRAIHEAYLNLQQAHRQFRSARDTPTGNETRAHADFQDATLTFYELIRPHLKRKSGVSKFWEGKLPSYPGRAFESAADAKRYYRQGVAIWGFQTHVETRPLPGGNATEIAVADGGNATLRDYHRQFDLSDMTRILALDAEESVIIWKELRAIGGLRQLDTWDTREVTERTSGNGFMASQTRKNTELRYVPVWKLTQAKRLLAEAADKMSLLSRVEIDHEDGAIVNFDQSRDDVQAEYRDAEYDSSPDI